MNNNMAIKIIKKNIDANNITYPFGLVGSAAIKKDFNDMDFLMIVDDIKKARQILFEAFNKYDVSICDDAVKISNLIPYQVSFALYEKEKVNEIVNNFMTGKNLETKHKVWCIAYWLPESFIEDLRKMKVINDNGNYLTNIKKQVSKNSIYAFKTIIDECLQEILIKKENLKKLPNTSIEYVCLKNEIIFSLLRVLYLLKDKYLTSFKHIDKLIEELNDPNLNSFINGDVDSLKNIIELLNDKNDDINRLYLGTWQFGGDFKQLLDSEIKSLILKAQSSKINKFDTAIVYGNGKVERILGECLNNTNKILTKVPARVKPSKDNLEALKNYYDYQYIIDTIKKSLQNLNRDKLDICLLHNWVKEWNNELEIIEWFNSIKKSGLVDKIGISLPNEYNEELPETLLSSIDVIEAPYNSENKWIIKSIDKYKSYGIEIILRSIFMHGKETDNYDLRLKEALAYGTSIVVGMTTDEQIEANVKVINERLAR